jgi:hypothetical protein
MREIATRGLVPGRSKPIAARRIRQLKAALVKKLREAGAPKLAAALAFELILPRRAGRPARPMKLYRVDVTPATAARVWPPLNVVMARRAYAAFPAVPSAAGGE